MAESFVIYGGILRNLSRNPAYHVGGDDDVRGCDGGQA